MLFKNSSIKATLHNYHLLLLTFHLLHSFLLTIQFTIHHLSLLHRWGLLPYSQESFLETIWRKEHLKSSQDYYPKTYSQLSLQATQDYTVFIYCIHNTPSHMDQAHYHYHLHNHPHFLIIFHIDSADRVILSAVIDDNFAILINCTHAVVVDKLVLLVFLFILAFRDQKKCD